MRLFKSNLLLTAVAILVVACGSDSQNSTPGPGANALPGGIWVGQIVAPGDVQPVLAVSTDAGDFRVLDVTTGAQFAGTMTVTGNSGTGTGFAWAADGTTWDDGSGLTSLEITANVTERTQISGDWTAGSGETGTLTLAYDDVHARPSSFASLASTWFFTDGTYSLILSIDSNGDITGSDSDGCVFVGSSFIPDAAFNTYELTIDLSSCSALNGRYGGLAFLTDSVATEDTLVVGLDDGTNSVVVALNRPDVT